MVEDDDSRQPDALSRLLELENDIAERLARARAEAEQSVVLARQAAARAEERFGEELAEEARLLAIRITAEHRAECTRIEERARRDAEAFDAAGEARLFALADALSQNLLDSSVPSRSASKREAR